METKETFSPFVDNWRSLNVDAIEMLLSEARRYEDFLMASTVRITQRIFAVMSILIPITAALISYLTNAIINKEFNDFLFIVVIYSIVFLLILLFRLGKASFPRMSEGIGTKPKDGFISEFIGLSEKMPNNKLPMMLAILESIERKTAINYKTSKQMWTVLRLSLRSILVFFTVHITILILYTIVWV